MDDADLEQMAHRGFRVGVGTTTKILHLILMWIPPKELGQGIRLRVRA